MSNFFRFKWGEGGDGLETPSQTTTVDGTVSEQEGFGSRYSLLYDPSNPELSNPNAIPLHRKLMNAIFNKITGAIQQYQKVGVPDFITSTNNNGVAFPYTVGSVCLLNGIQYRSLVANNTTTPPSSSWEKVAPSVLDSTNTLISSPSVAKNAFFTGVVTGKWLSIKIAGLATATAGGVLDFGGMTVKIMQDDRDANGVTVPDSWIVFIKGDMKNGVWENAQAINIGTDSTLTLPVSFTRTATDAFIEFDFTTIGTSYMSVVVEGVSTYIIGSYSPTISITMQSSKLGTLGTDATRSIVGNASLVDLAGKQPLNTVLTDFVNSQKLPVFNFANDDANNINKSCFAVVGANVTNLPANPQFLFTQYWNSTNIHQTCYTRENVGIWTRRNVGSGWTTWIKSGVEKSVNTVGITGIALSWNTFRLVNKETIVCVDASSLNSGHLFLLATIRIGTNDYVIPVAVSANSGGGQHAAGSFVVPNGAYYKIEYDTDGGVVPVAFGVREMA